MQCHIKPSTERNGKEEVSKNAIDENGYPCNLMKMKQKQSITYNHCPKKQAVNPVALFTLILGKNTDSHNNIGNG